MGFVHAHKSGVGGLCVRVCAWFQSASPDLGVATAQLPVNAGCRIRSLYSQTTPHLIRRPHRGRPGAVKPRTIPPAAAAAAAAAVAAVAAAARNAAFARRT